MVCNKCNHPPTFNGMLVIYGCPHEKSENISKPEQKHCPTFYVMGGEDES
jgi:hypothetical protein